MLLGIGDQVTPSAEAPRPPRRDDHDAGLERVVRQLETYLVVALARRAVRDGGRADVAGDLDLALGDERPRDRCAEEIAGLVDGVGAQYGKHEVARELLAQIVDVDGA